MLNGLKTYLGIALAVIGGLAAAWGIDPSGLPEWLDQLLVVIGGLLATLGRAHKEVRAPDPKP